MKNNTLKHIFAIILVLSLVLMSACGTAAPASGKTYTVGLCNYVDDASLNQIADSIQAQLQAVAEEKGVTIKVKYENCNADANVLQQIIANFISSGVDLMIGIATPVAMMMQAATEDSQIPVVFAAVSDPVSCGIVDSMDVPGGNITGTSDMLNTDAIIDLMFANDPSLSKVALLYDLGQDSSTSAIAQAKARLTEKGVEIVEFTGTNVEEITLAASAIVQSGAQAVFTPSDNTVMQAELSIYETLMNAGILQYCGADSFALNGAFCGYGVNYAQLGTETARMAAEILLSGASPRDMAVVTFDNGIATYNEDVIAALGMDVSEIEAVSRPFCSAFQTIRTAESFQ